jgi:hypothetical protein
MTDTATFPQMPQPLEGEVLERLRKGAQNVASWDVVHRPGAVSTFPARVATARAALKRLQAELARLPAAPTGGGASTAALLELRANSRLLRSAITGVSGRGREMARLPRIISSAQKEEPRVAAIAAAYFRIVNGEFKVPTFETFVRELQTREPLEVDELWSIAAFLKFVLVESGLDKAFALLRSPDSADSHAVALWLKSLLSISNADWMSLIEPLIVFDATLRLDPAGTYASMDFESRELYRKRVAFVARSSDLTESQVAQAALELAREGMQHPSDDARMQRRRIHVGYYLIDRGFHQLTARVEFHPRLIDRVRMIIRDHADDFFITGIQFVTILFIAAILFPILPEIGAFSSLIAVLMFIVLPVMQCAVDLVNNVVTALLDPESLPKLDFSKGVPPEFTTLVVVPTLLLKESQVRQLVTELEVRFLANRDPHVHFALLTDLADSVSKPHASDAHPLVDLAVHLIEELNTKYAQHKSGAFVLLHRHRIFNLRQGVWMGWERKRGKLLDLNKLLTGEFDAFPIKAGRVELLSQIRYVLTLDSDTQLPRKSAAKLIGTIAHPLNQAVIDPIRRVVVAGYGILQPRVGVSVSSASRSRMAAIYSGQNGFDIYTRAISDAYQDLYGEGSFTGKGIYEVAAFHGVLNARFPRNSLLSHDLIEGAYARAGLATDIEVIDDYPSHWSAYSRRKHRWVRGDWQIAQWLFARVPDEAGRWVQSPISSISRWKIFDNLRRSLVEPATMVLFAAGWLGLPGGPLYWTIVSLILLFFPSIVQLIFSLTRALVSENKGGVGEVFPGFRNAMLVALVNLALLPHQTLLTIDAIVRALVRQFITGERLLEWETAAQAEDRSAKRGPVDRYLALTPLVAIAIGVVVYFARPHNDAVLVAVPILLLWACAGSVTSWLDAPPQEEQRRLGTGEEAFLLGHAMRIWRYFSQFGGENHNYLIPDNVEEQGLKEAPRVSPTNIGLLLNARQAACEFGFLTVPEFAILTDRTLATITKLETFRGHLFNWYDTQTLKPLGDAPFVSSVDSGNLVASLYTLHSGALELIKQPLFSPHLFTAFRAFWQLMQSQKALPASLARLDVPGSHASVPDWIAWLPAASAALSKAASDSVSNAKAEKADPWWFNEARKRMDAMQTLLRDYMPWLMQEYAPLLNVLEVPRKGEAHSLSIDKAIVFAQSLDASLAGSKELHANDPSLLAKGEQLREALRNAMRTLRMLVSSLQAIAQAAERMADETEFAFLANPARQILSIGYDVRGQKLHEACYDLLASEARIATFLAVARDDLPQQSWGKLSRDHTRAFGQFILLSWTGTMFEYLMPALWMRSYPETLIAHTLAACVEVQCAFTRSIGTPWGISESGAADRNDSGHYSYHAYGVPQIALWVEAQAGPVISPYSTFLALGVESTAAVHNLRRMASSGWVGAFGFYEAADYVVSPGKAVLVREWMAHHQGMSLLALLNLLHGHVVQRWFHANPLIQSAELLLHEMPVSEGVLKAKLKE